MTAPVRALPVPASLLSVADRVERRLSEVLVGERARWCALDADLVGPLDAMAKLVLSSGKRLRPAFCHWGFIAAGGRPGDEIVVEAGAAFEFLQAFALVHDDVMDGSATRRGTQTTHLQVADEHAVQRWRGEGRRYGEGVAILVGDLAHVYADFMMRTAPVEARAVWDELRIELNMGQYLDVLGTARGDTDHTRARRIARYKSGKYTIERPLHVGAALAGGLHRLAEALSAYGDPLGEAFQLRDDILGAFGDQSVTGKPVGDDLREGKPTPLLAVTTLRARNSAAAQSLLQRIGSRDLDPAEVAAIQTLMVDCGALAEIEANIATLAHRAIAAAERAPIHIESKAALIELAEYVAWREK